MTGEVQIASEIEQAAIERQITGFKVAAWICVGLGFGAAAWGVFKIGHEAPSDLSELGGYLQGAVASTWSLAAFLFIYVAFLGQRQQMLLQREEFESQRQQFEIQRKEQQEQIDSQNKQFELQQESIKRQNFEASFFQLLNLQNQLVAGMRYPPGGHQGKNCFAPWHENFRRDFQIWQTRRANFPPKTNLISESLEPVVQFYADDFYSQHEAWLAPYFRNLYHIVKFVKTSDRPEKRRYTSLVRAQMSKYELFFLFYNCLSRHGKGFKPLVEEFGLLEHFDRLLMLDPGQDKLYGPTAFQ